MPSRSFYPVLPFATIALLALSLACGGGSSPSPSADPWAGEPTEHLSRDRVPYLIVKAEEGFVGSSTQLGLLRSDHRTEVPDNGVGSWTSVATNDQYIYTLQFDGKVYRRPDATSDEMEKLFESVPKYIDDSAYTGMAATSESLFVLDSSALESVIWKMGNEPTDPEAGPADLETVTKLPFRAVGFHADSAGTLLYTLPAPEGATELRSLWRWDQTTRAATETALSIPVPIQPTASISDTLPGLRAQMFSDESPWIGVVVQTELQGSPMRLSTIDERVFRVHADTGEVHIVGQRALTWP